MVYAEVDQSGKVEQFNMDTVVAISNDRRFAVLIPKKVKQQIYTHHKLPGTKYKMFASAIFECLKALNSVENKIVICNEYSGQDMIIKAHLMKLVQKEQMTIDSKSIVFSKIGKKSRAHELAISVHRNITAPDRIIRLAEIIKNMNM